MTAILLGKFAIFGGPLIAYAFGVFLINKISLMPHIPPKRIYWMAIPTGLFVVFMLISNSEYSTPNVEQVIENGQFINREYPS